MTAGNYDVVVHHDLFQRRPLRRALAAPGVRTRYGWKQRLVLAGKNTLAAGASRETAESIASICQQQGVAWRWCRRALSEVCASGWGTTRVARRTSAE